jgi:hypothetical protein
MRVWPGTGTIRSYTSCNCFIILLAICIAAYVF